MGLFAKRAPPAAEAAAGEGGAAGGGAAVERGAYTVDEHLLKPHEVAARFGTSIDAANVGASRGLTAAQVAEARKAHGLNQLTPPKTTPEIVKFLLQFTNPLMALLLVAGALTFMAYAIQSPRDKNNAILAAALIIVVTLTCIMSYWQERSASNVMGARAAAARTRPRPHRRAVALPRRRRAPRPARAAAARAASLKRMMPNKCTVMRDGVEQKVDAAELVPGDLVRLYIGDRVPADIRIIETADLKVPPPLAPPPPPPLAPPTRGTAGPPPTRAARRSRAAPQVECSSLTGESDLVPASVEAKHETPAEARNLVFMSSLAMNGEGRGIVVRTGDQTMIGKIATLATDTHTHRSTLQVEVHRLVWFVGALAFTVALILFVVRAAPARVRARVGLIRKTNPLVAFVNGFILVIVANVPEGLPATVTSLLSLTALRLRDRRVLIKRTDIIENLGVATIIASDKTGTLTQNKMTVENIFCNSVRARTCRRARAAAAAAARAQPAARAALTRTPAARRRRVAAQELHRGATFQPPPSAPLASLERASTLAKISLARRSNLGRASAALGRLSRITSGGLGRTSALARVSHDPATQMAVGRTGRPRGDGSFELEGVSSDGKPPAQPLPPMQEEAPRIGTFMVQSFAELSAITWERSSALTKLLTIAVVANKAKFTIGEDNDAGKQRDHTAITVPMFQGGEDTRQILGDATDSGLLRYCDRLAPSGLVRMAYKKVFDIPFNSANKWSLAVTSCPGDAAHQLVLMKGAPEIVLTKCSHHLRDGAEAPIDEAFRGTMNAAYERCGFMGERVIGFAYKKIPARSVESYHTDGAPTEGLVFMGLISLVDPPRPGVLDAVNKCRSAGIRVAMVTGDHPLTAEAIARKVGIVTLPTPREVAAEAGVPEGSIEITDERVGAVVITGTQLRRGRRGARAARSPSARRPRSAPPSFTRARGLRALTSEDDWDDILTTPEIVFARTSPQQKLQIVENLQRLGEVVAVTGDGVNDSPALKRAQIGVAMGKGGSDVARDAADIVLMDDEFPSIVAAIEEGRVIYDNLKKTIAYTLAHAVPEASPRRRRGCRRAAPRSTVQRRGRGRPPTRTASPAARQVWPLFLALVLNFPLGLGGLLILSIDLLTEQGPAISLAYEPAEAQVMERPPRDIKNDRLISGPLLRYAYITYGFITAGICMLSFFTIFWWHGVPLSAVYNHGDKYWMPGAPDLSICPRGGGACRVLGEREQLEIYWAAQSAWYVTLISSQFWHIWVCKTRTESIFSHGVFRNIVTVYGVSLSVVVMIVVVYVPFLQGIFTTWHLPGIGWVPMVGTLLWLLPYSEFTKRQVRTNPEGWWARTMAW
ncbi:Atpalpha [Scenedesmus sp. PABB004]|nr:Atpalpha [Scenedesmus sp. PABB004]